MTQDRDTCRDDHTIELMAVGDMCFSDHPLCAGFGVGAHIARKGFDFPFGGVADVLARADVVIGNLETSLAKGGPGPAAFRSDPRVAAALARNHFDLVTVANNHSLQQGEAAFSETVKHLRNSGVGPVGLHARGDFSCRPEFVEAQSQTLAFLGYSFTDENFHPAAEGYARGEPERVFADVARLATEVDHVVVACHWGVELAEDPPPGVVALGRGIIDAGARVVLGHHPHVWQGVEDYRHGVIFYSLGDFIFDLAWCRKCRETGLARIRLARGRPPTWEVVPAVIDRQHRPAPVVGPAGQRWLARLQERSARVAGLVAGLPGEQPSPEFLARVRARTVVNQRAKVLHVLRNFHRLGPGRFWGLAREQVRARIGASSCDPAVVAMGDRAPQAEPIKVLYCIDALVRGGTELQLLGLIKRLDRRRFSPYLLTIRPSPAELTPDDCPHLAWQVPRLLSLRGVRAMARLVGILRREDFRVVQTFFQDSTIFGGTAARLAGVPVRLACFRDLGFWRTRGQTLLLRRVYPMMTGFLCNADVVKRHVVAQHGLRPDRVDVVYNGIDTAALPWVDHAGPTLHVGIVGNLTRRVKRTDLFIQAAAAIARRPSGESVTWHVVGDGGLRAEYEALARAERIADRVVFAGRIADVAAYLERLQVGVLCSDSEGFSNALLEYMLKGCACVATDVGGNAEAVRHGRTGLLVPPGNAAALAEALEKLIVDTALRRELARQARAFAEAGFDWEKCVAGHEAIYLGE